ncbi:MAG: membrane protein [Erysipelotrichaceae bacterium]|nr:membrane protein [Erysipelotrichaceae bacterium]
MDNNMTKRIFWVIVSNIILSVGVTLLKYSNFGMDPFNCMNFGVSQVLGMSHGTYQMIFNFVLFIPIVLLDRSCFGIGAIINMILLGYLIDFETAIATNMGYAAGSISNIPVQIILMILGVVVVAFGVAIYMHCNLGASSWDYLGQLIEKKTNGKLPYKWARIGYDCIAIAIGFLTGATVGIATVIVGFFTGPLVSFFREKVATKLLGY